MELQLSTLDQVLLIITTSAITLFFLLGAISLIVGLVLANRVKKLVAKAEDAINSVEEATETIKNIGAHAGGPLAVFKIVKHMYDAFNRKK